MIAMSTTECTSSHEVTQAAQKRLHGVHHPNIRRLTCQCDERGTLYLRGRVSSYYQKQLAQEAVSGLAGVAEVVNQTEVVDISFASPALA